MIVYAGVNLGCLCNNYARDARLPLIHDRIKALQDRLGLDRCKMYSQNQDELLSSIGCHVENLYARRYQCASCGKMGYTESMFKTCKNVERYHEFRLPVYRRLLREAEALSKDDIFLMIGIIEQPYQMDVRLRCRAIYIDPVTDAQALEEWLHHSMDEFN